ncbi:DedA family protein, partial [Rhizobium ruizarguesonis]
LTYWSASLAASVGSFAGDQYWFFAGRYAARWGLVRRLMETPALARATRLLERYPTGFILAFRFPVAIRVVPMTIGLIVRNPTRKRN